MTDVTVPMDSSDGASAVLAIRSHAIQNILPHMVTAGIITIGLAVPKGAWLYAVLQFQRMLSALQMR